MANLLQPALTELFGIRCWSRAWQTGTQIIKQSKRCYTQREIKLRLLDSSGLPGELSRVSLMQPLAALAINWGVVEARGILGPWQEISFFFFFHWDRVGSKLFSFTLARRSLKEDFWNAFTWANRKKISEETTHRESNFCSGIVYKVTA